MILRHITANFRRQDWSAVPIGVAGPRPVALRSSDPASVTFISKIKTTDPHHAQLCGATH